MKKHDDVRENLMEMLDDLDEHLGKITADVRHSDETLPRDFAEQSAELENNGDTQSLGYVARDAKIKVRRTLKR